MLIKWLVTALIILALAYILPGIEVSGFIAAAVAALVLGLINMFLKPIIVLLTLPINMITLGLFTLVINAVIVLLAGSIVPGFSVGNFWWALLFSVVLGLTNSMMHKHRKPRYHGI